MISKSKMYDSKQTQPSMGADRTPFLLRNPTKIAVLAIQALFLIYQIEQYFHVKHTYESWIDRSLMIFFSVIVLFAFINDYKVIMKVHMWCSILIAAIPLASIQLLIDAVIKAVIFKSDKTLIGHASVESACFVILMDSTILICFAFYISMCHELIKNIEKKEKAFLPYSNQDSQKDKPNHPTYKI